jgi:NAD(P)-dependent dehydrogenase (short-subunit alcohol dehydrogenase family)
VHARAYGRCDLVQKELDVTDPGHLLLVGTGPGLGAAIARRFAREGYRLTLVARSEDTIPTIAEELRAAGADLADAYAVDVIGGVLTAQLAVPAMRAAGRGTLLFTGGGFADAEQPAASSS